MMPQGNLRERLDCVDGTPPLDLTVRVRIAWQAASALAFLHEPFEGAERTIHLDIKSENILLDSNYQAKVADFGLVRSLKTSDRTRTINVQGTIGWPFFSSPLLSLAYSFLFCLGYLCPKFQDIGEISDKTDVYAFGIVLAELLSRKKAVFRNGNGPSQHLGKLFREKIQLRDGMACSVPMGLIDPKLLNSRQPKMMELFGRLARQCIADDPSQRPSMSRVIHPIRK